MKNAVYNITSLRSYVNIHRFYRFYRFHRFHIQNLLDTQCDLLGMSISAVDLKLLPFTTNRHVHVSEL